MKQFNDRGQQIISKLVALLKCFDSLQNTEDFTVF